MTVNDERSDCNLTCSICLKPLDTSCLQNGKSETIEKDERRGWMMIFWLYKMAWEILQVVFLQLWFCVEDHSLGKEKSRRRPVPFCRAKLSRPPSIPFLDFGCTLIYIQFPDSIPEFQFQGGCIYIYAHMCAHDRTCIHISWIFVIVHVTTAYYNYKPPYAYVDNWWILMIFVNRLFTFLCGCSFVHLPMHMHEHLRAQCCTVIELYNYTRYIGTPRQRFGGSFEKEPRL